MKNKEFNSIATKCGFENHTSMLKFMETYGIILTEVDPPLTNSKDTLVSKIKQRIESEYRKHPDLDWKIRVLTKEGRLCGNRK